MKRFSLILLSIGLFVLTLAFAFQQGEAVLHGSASTALESASASALIYTGFKAQVALFFVNVFNGLMSLVGSHVAAAIILLALLVELVLLYPSVCIQLKQKKIHVFHKKLVDRFHRGELAYSKTKQEMAKLYSVNESIHSRGALFFVAQAVLLFIVFWGLNLLVRVPELLLGSWSVLNFSLLAAPQHFALPLTVGLSYFLHALIKIYVKEKEDYISSTQILVAVFFAIFSSALIYFASSLFALAFSLYFVTLVTFSTVRYLVVEQHAKAWGKLAQKELMAMLRTAPPHHDKFEYLSRKWNHLPVVRYINFHLLEEAVSMSLGLMIALNFFGVFQNEVSQLRAYLQNHLPIAVADEVSFDFTQEFFPYEMVRFCEDIPLDGREPVDCNNFDVDSNSQPDTWYGEMSFDVNGVDSGVAFTGFSDSSEFLQNTPPPASCCLTFEPTITDENGDLVGESASFQVVRPDLSATSVIDGSGYDQSDLGIGLLLNASSAPVGCNQANFEDGSSWYACTYQMQNILDVQFASELCSNDTLLSGTDYAFAASGGSGYFEWKVLNELGEIVTEFADGDTSNKSVSFNFPSAGAYTVELNDYFNPLNKSSSITCNVESPVLMGSCPADPLDVYSKYAFDVSGGGGSYEWLVSTPDGENLVLSDEEMTNFTFDELDDYSVQVRDAAFADNISEVCAVTVYPVCSAEFGLYKTGNTPLLLSGGGEEFMDVYGDAVYRFNIKNTFDGAFGITPNAVNAIDFTLNKGPDFVDFSFDYESADPNASFTLSVQDQTLLDQYAIECKTNDLNLIPKGPGPKAITPKIIRLGA